MTTSTTTRRPATVIAAAAAVATIAAGSVAVSLSHHHATGPAQPTHISVRQGTPPTGHFTPTTSGGRVMLGE